MTLKHNSFTLSILLLLGCGILIANSCSDTSLQKTTGSDEQPGKEKIMTEQENSNIGKRFPEVKAESLAKTMESIPDSAKGKVALIVVAFLQQSQPQLDSWLGPFGEKFGSQEGFTF